MALESAPIKLVPGQDTSKEPIPATSKGWMGSLLSVFSKVTVKPDLTNLPESILKKFMVWTDDEVKKCRSLDPKKDISAELKTFVDLTFESEKDQPIDTMIKHYATEFLKRLAPSEKRESWEDAQFNALNIALKKPVVDAYITRKSAEYKKSFETTGVFEAKPLVDELLHPTHLMWDFIVNDPLDSLGDYTQIHYPKEGVESDKYRIPRQLQRQFIDAIFPDSTAALADFKEQGRILIAFAHKNGFCKEDVFSITTKDYMICLKSAAKAEDFSKICIAFKRYQTLGWLMKQKHPTMSLDPKTTIAIARPAKEEEVKKSEDKPILDVLALEMLQLYSQYEKSKDGDVYAELFSKMKAYPQLDKLYYHVWNLAANVEKIDTSGDGDWGKTHCLDSVPRFIKALKAHLGQS